MCEDPIDSRIDAVPPASHPYDGSLPEANSTHPSPPHAAHTSSDLPQQAGTQSDESSVVEEPALSLVGLLRAFFEAQDVRVTTYQRLHDGFRRFLSARNESAYQQDLKRITADFQQCSRVVIAVGQQLVGRQAEMEALGVDEVLSDLGELQVAEKEKLRCELTLQALRLPYELKQFSWQGSEEEVTQPEATEDEWRSALADATQQLQGLVGTLNGKLQNLREAMQALIEEEGEAEDMQG